MPHQDQRTHGRSDADLPSDELVLAALQRASAHAPRAGESVPAWAVLEHLALPRRSRAARHVNARLEAMQTRGWLERARRHGVPTWGLSAAGKRRLRRTRRSGQLPPLPESPQHRAWRNARVLAQYEIERFRADVGARLQHALALLDAEPDTPSDDWLATGEELRRSCRRLGSATYCLREWTEPDDAHADVDEQDDPADGVLEPPERTLRRARRAGRRNVRLWGDLGGVSG